MIKTFEEKLALFDEYVLKYNYYPKSKEEYKDFNLGNWINNLRMTYNHGTKDDNNDIVYKSYRLTNDQINMLKKHNFYFSDFDMYLSLLKEYINTYNKYPANKEIYKDKDIGTWVTKNRVIYSNGIKDENGNLYYKTFKLTKNQLKKLEDMNFIWKSNRYKNTWRNNYILLIEFIEENNRFPKTNEEYNGKNIGAWLNNQRLNFNKGKEVEKDVYRYRNNSPTTKEQIYKLNNLGVEFVIDKNRYDKLPIRTQMDLLTKRRYLLLKLDNLIKNNNIEFKNKEDIEDLNKEFIKILNK